MMSAAYPGGVSGGLSGAYSTAAVFPRSSTHNSEDVFLPSGVTSPLAMEVPSLKVTTPSQTELCNKLNKFLERNLSSSSDSESCSIHSSSPTGKEM